MAIPALIGSMLPLMLDALSACSPSDMHPSGSAREASGLFKSFPILDPWAPTKARAPPAARTNLPPSMRRLPDCLDDPAFYPSDMSDDSAADEPPGSPSTPPDPPSAPFPPPAMGREDAATFSPGGGSGGRAAQTLAANRTSNGTSSLYLDSRVAAAGDAVNGRGHEPDPPTSTFPDGEVAA